jgi:hypothetical protein
LIAPGSLAGAVVQALRHIGPARGDSIETLLWWITFSI